MQRWSVGASSLVGLASLMAIFWLNDLSKAVQVEDWTILMKEAGKALLEARLASLSAGGLLDKATNLQMVRAINKVPPFWDFVCVRNPHWCPHANLVNWSFSLLSKLLQAQHDIFLLRLSSLYSCNFDWTMKPPDYGAPLPS
jgi:hypothetical protein